MAATKRDIAGYSGAELIGRGGFSAVYRASDPAHGRTVAIKVLDGALGEAERRRFDRERQAMGRLGSHPNIIGIYDSGYTADGEAYLVMELASGGSLRSLVETRGPVPWPEAVELMATVAVAAQAAHDFGVLHRDIKPDNILIDQFNNPKLSDFGIAALVDQATATRTTTATVAHAAPEVFGGRPGTAARDIYAIGSTLHTILTGAPPFVRDTDEDVAAMIARALHEPPPDLRSHGVPDAVAAAVERAMAKDPADRQPSAAELARELTESAAAAAAPSYAQTRIAGAPAPTPDHLLGDHPPAADASPAGRWSAVTTSAAGRGAMIAAAAVVAFALVAVAIIIGSGSDNDADPDAGTEAASGSEPSSSTDPVTQAPADETTTTVAVAPPSARIDCPTEITLGQRVDCFIISADATSGQWELPGMLDQPLAIELVPGRSQIFLEPTPPIAVGDTFRIVATVVSADGAEVTATHRFEIIGPPETVGPSVRIDCPETVAVGTSVNCDITSANAASGEWSIPEFASGPLETVPGTYAIFIAPDNPSVVGQTFTITATVTNSDGRSATATNHFTVTAAGG